MKSIYWSILRRPCCVLVACTAGALGRAGLPRLASAHDMHRAPLRGDGNDLPLSFWLESFVPNKCRYGVLLKVSFDWFACSRPGGFGCTVVAKEREKTDLQRGWARFRAVYLPRQIMQRNPCGRGKMLQGRNGVRPVRFAKTIISSRELAKLIWAWC